MATPPVLDPGHAADDDSYRPSVTLEHQGNELYVVVGEEVGGMIEGVSEESFKVIRERLNPGYWEQRIANENARETRERGACPVCGSDWPALTEPRRNS